MAAMAYCARAYRVVAATPFIHQNGGRAQLLALSYYHDATLFRSIPANQPSSYLWRKSSTTIIVKTLRFRAGGNGLVPAYGDTICRLFIALWIFAGTPIMITHQPVRLSDEQSLHVLSALDWLKAGHKV